jgi:hypothetical protein
LQITFEGREVKSPWASTVEIQNSGNVPIEEADVESPITVNFKPADILFAEITRTLPRGVNASIEHDKHILTVKHKLLNPDDRLVINLILDGEPDLDASGVNGRISGVSRLIVQDTSADVITHKEPYWNFPRLLSSALAVIVTVVGLWLIYKVFVEWWLTEVRRDWFLLKPNWQRIVDQIENRLERPSYIHGSEALEHVLERAYRETSPVRWLDDPHELERYLAKPEAKTVLERFQKTPEDVRDEILSFLKLEVRRTAFNTLMRNRLLGGLGRYLAREVDKIEVTTRSKYLDHIHQVLASANIEAFGGPSDRMEVIQDAVARLLVAVGTAAFITWFVSQLWQAIL